MTTISDNNKHQTKLTKAQLDAWTTRLRDPKSLQCIYKGAKGYREFNMKMNRRESTSCS